MEEIRLNKYLAQAGIDSRRKVDKLIESGRVKVNGKKAEMGQKIILGKDVVEVSGQKVDSQEEKVYYLINKPQKVLSASKDDRKRRVVTSLINDKKRIFNIGRLDYETEGFLLLSNDGDIFNRIMHPKAEIYKVYLAKIESKITSEKLNMLEKGVELEDGMTLPARAKLVKNENGNSWVEISIREGRNRQVRRMFDSIGHRVLYLKRLSVGKLKLGTLEVGEYRKLRKDEIDYLKNL